MKTQIRILIKKAVIITCFFLIGGFSGIPCSAQEIVSAPLTMAPYKIVLNAVGNSLSIKGIINMPLQDGYYLSDYEVLLLIEGEAVAEAFSFRYCYIDDNFIAEFDREGILGHPLLLELAGETSQAVVEGWYSAENAQGESITKFFTSSDQIEILSPGKK